MRKIAEAIEYSPTAIYLHFKDKDASSASSASRTSTPSRGPSSGSPASRTRSSG